MITQIKAPMQRAEDFQESWRLVDAKDMILGRIAGRIARFLQGKDDTKFAPHVFPKNYIVIINAEKIGLTGKKYDDKEEECYYYHTGHPGGIKQETYRQTLTGKRPERVILRAIKRMLPKDSPRARDIFACVKAYVGPDHPHQAQKPLPWDLAEANPKNKIR
jgi:large subunit ribosomal protein L13